MPTHIIDMICRINHQWLVWMLTLLPRKFSQYQWDNKAIKLRSDRIDMARDIEYSTFSLTYNFDRQSPIPNKALKRVLISNGFNVLDNEQPVTRDDEPASLILTDNEILLAYFERSGSVALLIGNPESVNIRSKTDLFEEVIFETIGVDREELHTLELQFEGIIWAGKDTTELFSGVYSGIDLSDVLGKQGHPASLRFISHPDMTKQVDLFDVRLEPYVQNTDYYYMHLRFNDSESEEVLTFASNINAKVDELLGLLEEEG